MFVKTATAITFAVLMMFTTNIAFAGQQAPAQQITLSIGSFTISADQLTYDSESGVLKASGNVALEIKDHLKATSPESMEIKIDRANSVAEGRIHGHLLAQVTQGDGSVHSLDTVGLHFVTKF